MSCGKLVLFACFLVLIVLVPAQAATRGEGGVEVIGDLTLNGGGIAFPDGTVQTTASMPTWSQILSATERFQLVMGGAAVLDRETGLVWVQAPDSTQKRTWIEALSYCYQLVLGGRKGWRLPSVTELSTLVDMSAAGNPQLPDNNPFTNVMAQWSYWSSTIDEYNGTDVQCVSMYNGMVISYGKLSLLYSWCVRGAQ